MILVEPENSINVGMIARAMMNFGYSDLWLVSPMFDSLDRAEAAAMRAADILRSCKIVVSLEEALEGTDLVVGTTARVAIRSPLRRAVELRSFAESLRWGGKVGLVFGRESTGLTNEELSLCDVVVTIPTSREYAAMNLANAAAVVLYEMSMASRGGGKVEPVPRGLRERTLIYLGEILSRIGLPDHKERRLMLTLGRILGRAYPCGVTREEATYLLEAVVKVKNRLEVCDRVA